MKKIFYLITVFMTLSISLAACSPSNNKTKHHDEGTIVEESNIYSGGMELSKINIINDKIEILVPKSFDIMSEEMLEVKYPSENRPTLVYTNESASVNIAFNHTDNRATMSDMPELMEAFVTMFTNLYPSAQWYREGLEELNGIDVGVLELITPAIDTEIYNLMWFTILDGRVMMATFNCTKEQMSDWKETASHIMGSFKLK